MIPCRPGHAGHATHAPGAPLTRRGAGGRRGPESGATWCRWSEKKSVARVTCGGSAPFCWGFLFFLFFFSCPCGPGPTSAWSGPGAGTAPAAAQPWLHRHRPSRLAVSHGNLGDSILHLAEVEAAALCGKSVAVTCRMREKSAWPACPPPAQLLDSLGADPLILLHAGGNWGDVWPKEQRPRLDYLNRLDAGLSARNSSARVVQLPQSLYYSDSHTRAQDEAALASLRNINLTIYARQASSLAHAPSPAPRLAVKLLPDMAFVLSPVTLPEPMVDVLVIARIDKESVLGMPHANVSALANTVLGPHNIRSSTGPSPRPHPAPASLSWPTRAAFL